MHLELFNTLKKHIEDNIPEIKNVRLFNNQFNRDNVENAFLYPCCMLQFNSSNFKELSQGVQQCDIMITTHLGFESYKDEDTDVLRLKQDLYKVVNRFRNDTFSRILRVSERENFDHDNIQVYETDYMTTGKDFRDDIRPSIPVLASYAMSAYLTSSVI